MENQTMTLAEKALLMHEKWNGKLETIAKSKVNSREDLAIAYTPGVAEPCKMIAKDPEAAYKYTMKANTVAVIGDSTFMHSGVTGLINIAYNESTSTVIILDNSITGMTGHQQNPTTGFNLKGDPCTKIDLEALCHAVGIRRVRVVDPYDLAACDKAVKEELAADEPSVIISRRPCALLKYVRHPGPIEAKPEKCVGCKSCMKLGCPAISVMGGKVQIDNTLCTGCGLCRQLCHKGALGE